MIKKLTTTLGAIALLIIPAAANATPEIGQPAPDFETTDIAGNPFKLSDHKGDIVVLEWSNHDCPFVVKHYSTDNMQSVQKAARAQGVKWVTIVSSGKGRQGNVSAEEAQKITNESGADIDAKILDPSGKIGKLFDAKTTPHMYVIDATGTLAYAGAIDDKSSPNPKTVKGAKNYVLAAIDDLKSGNAVRTAQTAPYGCSIKYAR